MTTLWPKDKLNIGEILLIMGKFIIAYAFMIPFKYVLVFFRNPNGDPSDPVVWPAYDEMLHTFLIMGLEDKIGWNARDHYIGASLELVGGSQPTNPTNPTQSTTVIPSETTDGPSSEATTGDSSETTVTTTSSEATTEASGDDENAGTNANPMIPMVALFAAISYSLVN